MSPRSPAVPAPSNALAAVLARRGGGLGSPGAPLRSVQFEGSTVVRGDGPDVLFPVTALFGLINMLPDGPEVEVATIGWEGVFGYPAAAGATPVGNHLLCHIPGQVLQIPRQTLLEHLANDDAARGVFEHYTTMSATLLAQRAACGQRHTASGRYATWLLACADRLGTGTPIPLTQHVLAIILGLQRTTVSSIAGRLEQQGLTRNNYGTVQILSRTGLKAAACACYPRYRMHVTALLAHARTATARPQL